jgi:leucyl aminopeptidase
MYLCYVDESGTPDLPGNTSHHILAGVSIPVQYWRDCDRDIETIKVKYGLGDQEIHVAWLLRSYPEQHKIPNFATLDYAQRKYQVTAFRHQELLRLQRAKKPALYQQTRKNYKKTENYLHLTQLERQNLIRDLANTLASWGFARLFAECINKIHFDPARSLKTIDEQAFEQIISRFEQYLQVTGLNNSQKNFGLLIHDNNETVAKKHTVLMKKFHKAGTLWTNLNNIIETPLFVDSELTGMVQIADLCAYALRRYLENNETELFDLIFKRADRKGEVVVGVRHFTHQTCACKICSAHRKPPAV